MPYAHRKGISPTVWVLETISCSEARLAGLRWLRLTPARDGSIGYSGTNARYHCHDKPILVTASDFLQVNLKEKKKIDRPMCTVAEVSTPWHSWGHSCYDGPVSIWYMAVSVQLTTESICKLQNNSVFSPVFARLIARKSTICTLQPRRSRPTWPVALKNIFLSQHAVLCWRLLDERDTAGLKTFSLYENINIATYSLVHAIFGSFWDISVMHQHYTFLDIVELYEKHPWMLRHLGHFGQLHITGF